MSEANSFGFNKNYKKNSLTEDDFDEIEIECIDCSQIFVWTGGEQLFFHDKNLKHPPKRCKSCKQAKNERLSAISKAQEAGITQKIEVSVNCVKCTKKTTVPFYPSQGRPVYCRSCYLEINPNILANDNS